MSAGLAYVEGSDGVLSACRDLITAAEHHLVLQMYLFARNGDQTTLLPRPGAFPYADAVASLLVEKKRARPDATVVVILDSNTPSDPARTRRKGELVREELTRAGIIVLNACLFGTRFERRRRLFPRMNFHLDHGRVPYRDWVHRQNQWQALHNVEDHRKNLVIDGGRAGAVTSHNFFDAAYDWHENLFWLTGAPASELWRAAIAAIADALTIPQAIDATAREALEALERAPARGEDGEPLAPTRAPVPGYPVPEARPGDLRAPFTFGLTFDDPSCALVQNEAIRPRLEALIDEAGPGDEVLAATTYFSDLRTLDRLARAAERGARVRVLIDSVRALPLPPALSWLTRSLVNHEVLTRAPELERRYPGRFTLRVHDSRGGAMMHLKTAARVGRAPMLLGGQANYTPNSFSGAWLETDVETRSPAIVAAFADHFERLWSLDASRACGPVPGAAMKTTLLAMFRAAGLEP